MLDDFRDEEENLNKGSEFLDEFRQRLNSQPIENLEERKNDISKSQHIFLGTVLGIGLAGLVSWFILSPDYNKVEDAEIPVIRRPQTAIKIQPADPGGMEILNQDKTVYDIVEKKESEEIKVENLLPPPEEPSLAIVQIEESTSENQPQKSDPVKEAEKILATENKTVVTEQIKNESQEIKEVKVEKIITTPEKTPKKEVEKIIIEETKVAVNEETKPKSEQKSASNESAPSVAPNGSWQIQLISSPNKSAMEKAWKDLKQKYSALKDLPHEIESADLGSKGTFYRLKAGAFQNREDADKLCNSIKAAGGSCIVKKK